MAEIIYKGTHSYCSTILPQRSCHILVQAESTISYISGSAILAIFSPVVLVILLESMMYIVEIVLSLSKSDPRVLNGWSAKSRHSSVVFKSSQMGTFSKFLSDLGKVQLIPRVKNPRIYWKEDDH